ncbi:MAG: hypothetical protein EP330_05975 [Deltaproteobacteria bacterium]|nr:MAG: hypothetical protein EP330_05975 [Deltaproteobacteria bacterium]
MSDEHFQVYNDMKEFIGFTAEDEVRLQALGPVFAKHGPGITDRFYDSLQAYPKTAKIVEGRVEALKSTHKQWMTELFAGEYGRPFFDRQYVIGQVHVVNNINPEFVEAVTSTLRTFGRLAVFEEMGSNDDAGLHSDSLAKILDLALMTINLAYADERIDRMSNVTGMSRRLIENLIKRGAKK